MKVILVSGKARHGKDTVAEILNSELTNRGYRVLTAHYADLVKYICHSFFGWNGEKDENGRTLLQYVGTDIVRSHNPNYWVDFLVSVFRMFGDNWDYVLVSDCRFPNEIDGMRNAGFDTMHIRVRRPGFESGLTAEQLNHLSETALDSVKPDVWLENTGTQEDLRNKIITWIEEKFL